jgi:hypothetical protein
MEVILFSLFDTVISFKDHELLLSSSFEINRQQLYKGLSLNGGWKRVLFYVR